jgi:competence protein ComGC
LREEHTCAAHHTIVQVSRRVRPTAGLTLVEVLIAAAFFVILVLLFLPAIPHEKRSPRILCTAQIKQVALAYILWANDNDQQFPFASTNAANSRAFVNSPDVFRHYLVISNELVTPQVLACPADKKRKPASTFAGLSNENISYFVGLDANPDQPQSLLSGDRNITGGTLSNRFMLVLSTNTATAWTPELHENAGNVGFSDGSAQQLGSAGLSEQLASIRRPLVRLAIPIKP